MGTTTTNLGLFKPELSDPADITATNPNWDKLDQVIKENKDEAKAYTDQKIASIPTPDVSEQVNEALTEAKSYTDNKIAAIPTPDVSGQIGTHNTDGSAHADIRTAVNTAQTTATNALNTANSKAPMYTYGTEDLTAGTSPLESGKLHFVYE